MCASDSSQVAARAHCEAGEELRNAVHSRNTLVTILVYSNSYITVALIWSKDF